MEKEKFDKFYVQITTKNGNRKFRKYSPEKVVLIKENLPEGCYITYPMRKEHWKDRRSYFRKKRFKRILKWITKYRFIIGLIIAFLTLVILTISIFV